MMMDEILANRAEANPVSYVSPRFERVELDDGSHEVRVLDPWPEVVGISGELLLATRFPPEGESYPQPSMLVWDGGEEVRFNCANGRAVYRIQEWRPRRNEVVCQRVQSEGPEGPE